MNLRSRCIQSDCVQDVYHVTSGTAAPAEFHMQHSLLWYTAATAALAAAVDDAAAASAAVTLRSRVSLKLENDCTVSSAGSGASCCSRVRV